MMKPLRIVAVLAICLFPFAAPHSALAWTALSYQEAVWMCGNGDLQACEVMYAYEEVTSGGWKHLRHAPLPYFDK
jgi:hypothetical protein